MGFCIISGSKVYENNLNYLENSDTGTKSLTPDGLISAAFIKLQYGEGTNIPTANGYHSIVIGSLTKKMRAVTSSHELFGLGIPSAKKMSASENNANAIRADNLTRRLLGMDERDGTDHGTTKDDKMPITK